MPPIFKALATIAVWILFISGCFSALTTTINWLLLVGFIGEPPAAAFCGWGLAGVMLILSVVVMKLRKMLE